MNSMKSAIYVLSLVSASYFSIACTGGKNDKTDAPAGATANPPPVPGAPGTQGQVEKPAAVGNAPKSFPKQTKEEATKGCEQQAKVTPNLDIPSCVNYIMSNMEK